MDVDGPACALLAAYVALASPTPSPTPTALPVIGVVRVVTGAPQAVHQLPVPASVLDQQAILHLPARTADQVLSYLPGFDRNRSNSMFTNYGQLRVSFAGLGNDRGLLLVDGIPAQDGFGGQVDWAQFPTPSLVRAELLRGPGSALYGGGAIGGVLSLQTFGPTTALAGAAQGTLSFSGGSHGFTQNYVQTTAPLGGKLSGAFTAFTQQMQYFALAPGYQTKHDDESQAQSNMASVRLRYASDLQTTFEYGYLGAWDYQQEGRPNYDFWRNMLQHAFRFSHTTRQSELTGSVYVRNAFVTNRADVYPSAPGTLLYTQYVPGHESGVLLNWIAGSERATFAVLANAKFVSGVSDQYNGAGAFSVSGSGTQDSAGLALQETLRWARLELVGGLRGDAIDLARAATQKGTTVTAIAPRIDRALSPRIATRYDLSKELAFRASAGGGFRAPYLNELVRGYQIGAVQYVPNATLVPERSSSLVGGFDWLHANSELSIDYTHAYVNDAIDFRTISPTLQMRSNFSHTQTDGTTLVYVRRLGTCSRMTLWGMQQYARITAGTPAEVGRQLPYVPKASASAEYDTPIGSVQIGASLNYSGMTWADDLNQQPLGSAVTAGIHVVAPLPGGVDLTLNVSNLTDARYFSSIDRYAPPQVVSLALAAPLGSSQASACSK